jgi:protein-tyrosine-phosphatase
MKVGILALAHGFLSKQKSLVCICHGNICKSKLAVDTAELEVERWIIWSECDVANKILSVVDKTVKISLKEVRNQNAKKHGSQVGR